MRDCYPAVILLPGGERANLIPGSRPARYEISGEPCNIDVTIPDDLLAQGWCWSGSFLYQPWPERPDGPGVAIATCTYPPPGYPSDARGTCFDAARRLDALRTELQARRMVKPVKKAKKKRAPVPAVPVEVEPEQMEFAL